MDCRTGRHCDHICVLHHKYPRNGVRLHTSRKNLEPAGDGRSLYQQQQLDSCHLRIQHRVRRGDPSASLVDGVEATDSSQEENWDCTPVCSRFAVSVSSMSLFMESTTELNLQGLHCQHTDNLLHDSHERYQRRYILQRGLVRLLGVRRGRVGYHRHLHALPAKAC